MVTFTKMFTFLYYREYKERVTKRTTLTAGDQTPAVFFDLHSAYWSSAWMCSHHAFLAVLTYFLIAQRLQTRPALITHSKMISLTDNENPHFSQHISFLFWKLISKVCIAQYTPPASGLSRSESVRAPLCEILSSWQSGKSWPLRWPTRLEGVPCNDTV